MSNLAYQNEISTEMPNGEIVAMSPRTVVNHVESSAKQKFIYSKKIELIY